MLNNDPPDPRIIEDLKNFKNIIVSTDTLTNLSSAQFKECFLLLNDLSLELSRAKQLKSKKESIEREKGIQLKALANNNNGSSLKDTISALTDTISKIKLKIDRLEAEKK